MCFIEHRYHCLYALIVFKEQNNLFNSFCKRVNHLAQLTVISQQKPSKKLKNIFDLTLVGQESYPKDRSELSRNA